MSKIKMQKPELKIVSKGNVKYIVENIFGNQRLEDLYADYLAEKIMGTMEVKKAA